MNLVKASRKSSNRSHVFEGGGEDFDALRHFAQFVNRTFFCFKTIEFTMDFGSRVQRMKIVLFPLQILKSK